MRATSQRPLGFTLVELLVVIAIIAILASLLLPALARAKEKAKVVKVHAELYGVGLALEMYADDHEGQLPPVRVNCNSDLVHALVPVSHRAGRGGLPGPRRQTRHGGEHGGRVQPGPHLQVRHARVRKSSTTRPAATTSFGCRTISRNAPPTPGNTTPAAPTRPCAGCCGAWGPVPTATRHRIRTRPIANRSWYRRAGDGGVIARMATRDGMQFKTP